MLQYDRQDCGPACIKIVLEIYGKQVSIEKIRQDCAMTTQGTSVYDLSLVLEQYDFNTRIVQISWEEIRKYTPPFILWIHQNHFVIAEKISSSRIWLIDPAIGFVNYSRADFIDKWSLSEEQ